MRFLIVILLCAIVPSSFAAPVTWGEPIEPEPALLNSDVYKSERPLYYGKFRVDHHRNEQPFPGRWVSASEVFHAEQITAQKLNEAEQELLAKNGVTAADVVFFINSRDNSSYTGWDKEYLSSYGYREGVAVSTKKTALTPNEVHQFRVHIQSGRGKAIIQQLIDTKEISIENVNGKSALKMDQWTANGVLREFLKPSTLQDELYSLNNIFVALQVVEWERVEPYLRSARWNVPMYGDTMGTFKPEFKLKSNTEILRMETPVAKELLGIKKTLWERACAAIIGE